MCLLNEEPSASIPTSSFQREAKRQRVGPIESFVHGRVLSLAPASETRGYELVPGQLPELEEVCKPSTSYAVSSFHRAESHRDSYLFASLRPSMPEQPASLAAFVRSREAMGSKRLRPTRHVQQVITTKAAGSLREEVVPEAILAPLDKAFASSWVNDRYVLVGTKCNSLLCIDTDTYKFRRLCIPPEPSRPLNYSEEVNPFGSCGIHTIAVNPSGTLLATGGMNPRDIALLTIPEDPSKGNFGVQGTFVSHQDWLFGLAWLSDDRFVSASRDQTLKVWSVNGPFTAPEVCYDPLVSVHQGSRARDVKFDPVASRLVSLGTDGLVNLWDAGRMTKMGAIFTGHNRELACMALQGSLVATGCQSHATLLDARSQSIVVDIESVDQGHGVRSLAFRDHLLSLGTGRGRLAFYDMRMHQYLEIERELTSAETANSSAGNLLPSVMASRRLDLTESESGCPPEASPGVRMGRKRPARTPTLYYQTSDGRMDHNEVYRTHFEGMHVFSACYSQNWNPSSSRLFVSGGPLAFGLRGCYMSIFK